MHTEEDEEETQQADPWYEWLLHLRHADDASEQIFVSKEVQRYANRVLDGAQLKEGMTLVDVGTGAGLVAFAAIDRIGPSLKVIFTDLSKQLLAHVRQLAVRNNLENRCEFYRCNAEDMGAIADSSADVVTVRSVLAYVVDRQAAFREIHRILKPNGRLSLAEPIMMDDARVTCALRASIDAVGLENADSFLSLMHRWKSAQFPDTPQKMAACPMTNFTERDLVGAVQSSGFGDIHMEFHVDVRPFVVSSWDVFISSTPHPLAPSLQDIMRETFSPQERQLFESIIRPIVVSQKLMVDERMVYLTACKN